MKAKTTYICETCGYESENKDAVFACEAGHLGLTPEEKKEYDHLENLVERWSKTVYRENNEQTRGAYDSAITRLMAFEVEHGLDMKA